MTSQRPYHAQRPHPWHGLTAGDDSPDIVNVYIEMTPSDGVKYEIDKDTGYLVVDRARKYSSQLPTAYGFIPRTYCEDRVAALSDETDQGDLDPLDVCVVSGCPIERSQILLTARVVGGLHMIDKGEADDKIIAVLEDDNVWGDVTDVSELPGGIIQKIRHYFLTYKMTPGEDRPKVSIDEPYGAAHAHDVIRASVEDYNAKFGE